jgi:hypothetical protein
MMKGGLMKGKNDEGNVGVDYGLVVVADRLMATVVKVLSSSDCQLLMSIRSSSIWREMAENIPYERIRWV